MKSLDLIYTGVFETVSVAVWSVKDKELKIFVCFLLLVQEISGRAISRSDDMYTQSCG